MLHQDSAFPGPRLFSDAIALLPNRCLTVLGSVDKPPIFEKSYWPLALASCNYAQACFSPHTLRVMLLVFRFFYEPIPFWKYLVVAVPPKFGFK